VTDLAQAPRTVLEIAREAGAFTTFMRAAERAGLDDVLRGPGPLTIFVPSDEAFRTWPPGTVEGLLAEPVLLHQIVGYHIVPRLVTAADAAMLRTAPTVQGEDLYLSVRDGVRVDGARLLMSDICASNGLVHIIDRVLLPARL
jgi:uncharacterized surface protein with fasciclin (FAS1) repeats